MLHSTCSIFSATYNFCIFKYLAPVIFLSTCSNLFCICLSHLIKKQISPGQGTCLIYFYRIQTKYMVLCKWFSFKNNNNFLSKLILRFVLSFYLLCSLCCCQVVGFFSCIFKYLHFFIECLNWSSLLELPIFLWEVPTSQGKIIGSLEVIRILPFTSPGAKFHAQPQRLVVPVPWSAIRMIAKQLLIRVAIKCWRIYKLLSSFFIYMTVSNPFPSTQYHFKSFYFSLWFPLSLQLCSFL